MSVDFSGIALPFSASDLLSAGVSLLSVVGPYVLLGMAFLIVPLLVGLVVRAFKMAASRGKSA